MFEAAASVEHACYCPFRDLARIEARDVERGELDGVPEHMGHFSDVARVELRDVERGELVACFEHVAHIRDVARFELRDVERGEASAAFEHLVHHRDVARFELRDVERREAAAGAEHAAHVRDLGGVQLAQALNAGELAASAEPSLGGRGLDLPVLRLHRDLLEDVFILAEDLGLVVLDVVDEVEHRLRAAAVRLALDRAVVALVQLRGPPIVEEHGVGRHTLLSVSIINRCDIAPATGRSLFDNVGIFVIR